MVYTGANECLGVLGSWLVSTSSSVGRLRFSPACYKSRSLVIFKAVGEGGVGGSPRRALVRSCIVGGKTEGKKKKRREEKNYGKSLRVPFPVVSLPRRTNENYPSAKQRDRVSYRVPCANRRLKSTSHRWVYLRRKSKPSF